MPGLQFFEEAAGEIEKERQWYRDRSAIAETSFLRELDHAFEVITDAPDRWPSHIGGTRRYVFPKFPFSIVYFFEEDTIFVVALAHESKRPGYWRERLS